MKHSLYLVFLFSFLSFLYVFYFPFVFFGLSCFELSLCFRYFRLILPWVIFLGMKPHFQKTNWLPLQESTCLCTRLFINYYEYMSAFLAIYLCTHTIYSSQSRWRLSTTCILPNLQQSCFWILWGISLGYVFNSMTLHRDAVAPAAFGVSLPGLGLKSFFCFEKGSLLNKDEAILATWSKTNRSKRKHLQAPCSTVLPKNPLASKPLNDSQTMI